MGRRRRCAAARHFKTAEPTTAQAAEPVVVGFDGGYVRSRHRHEERRHFEVIAGKVIDAHGHPVALRLLRATVPRQSRPKRSSRRSPLLACRRTRRPRCCVTATPGCGGCSVRCCRRPRVVLATGGMLRCTSSTRCRRPGGLGACAADTHLADEAVRELERAKWRFCGNRRWPGCRRKLATLRRGGAASMCVT